VQVVIEYSCQEHQLRISRTPRKSIAVDLLRIAPAPTTIITAGNDTLVLFVVYRILLPMSKLSDKRVLAIGVGGR
jgi:hypothetical protein